MTDDERTALRRRLRQNGETEFVRIPVCTCKKAAKKVVECGHFIGWTKGRRGPPGGVCGACYGAIPEGRR